MLTRCPACDTTFRVGPEQLKVRQGKVRCGECQHVFNALDTLVDEVAVPAPVRKENPTTSPSQGAYGSETGFAAVPPAPIIEEPALVPALADEKADASTPVIETIGLDELPATPEPEPVPPASGEATTAETAVTADLPSEAPEAVPETPPPDPLLHDELPLETPPRRWPWVTGAIFAILTLVVQSALHFRTELAVIAPEARPLLEVACDLAGCAIELPRKADLMAIETSDLQPDPEHPGQLLLTALLRNRAPFAQAYPHLELSLTDTNDKVLARRALAPEDYLRKASRAAMVDNGIPSGETPVTVRIQSGDAGAAGYRLYLFYP